MPPSYYKHTLRTRTSVQRIRDGDQRMTKLPNPTIHILYLFYVALGEGALVW